MAVLSNTGIRAGASGAVSGYQIANSLRFNDGDSPYLNRTPSGAGNRKTWTYSAWIKRATLSSTSHYNLLSCMVTSNDDFVDIRFNADDLRMDITATDQTRVQINTTALFRDPSAWYHVVIAVDTTQTSASNRCKIYINNVQQTTTNTLNEDIDTAINAAAVHNIGRRVDGSDQYFDGCMADVNLIDGLALTPSSFGETNEDTNQWVAKEYTGSYGTNGFNLKFSGSDLGEDSAGSNDWTANNFTVTDGSNPENIDVFTDTPTSFDDGGNGTGNYCTMNPIHHLTDITLSQGNLTTSTSGYQAFSTFLLTSGKWYVEHTVTSTGYNLCFSQPDHPSGASPSTGTSKSIGYYQDGTFYWGAGNASLAASFTSGDVLAAAIDMDGSTIKVYKNNSLQTTIDFTSGTYHRFADGMYISQFSGYGHWNFGQRAFKYTPPTGYKAINTYNLSDPTITDPGKHFEAKIYDGASGTNAITGIGFNPDLVWIKNRTNANSHALFDSVRGVTKLFYPNDTAGEDPVSDFDSFDSDGFTLSGSANSYNNSSYAYVTWNWDAGSANVTNDASSTGIGTIDSTYRVNTDSGFSIVSYTGNSTAGATIAHGLNAVPSFMIIKNRATEAWVVYHKEIGATKYLVLHDSAAAATSSSPWNDTAPTSTVFSVGSWVGTNGSANYMAYIWSEVAGYSKFGSYDGNGSNDGPFINCGFTPRYMLIKNITDSGANWVIKDSARVTYNENDKELRADTAAADATGYRYDLLSNGFKNRSNATDTNTSSKEYVFAAFANNPFKYTNAR